MDNLTPAQRSETMRRVRSVDTTPELLVRSAVHGMGFRYGLHCRRLAGCPDLVLSRLRTVIFVHGCFWHCHCCPGAELPRSNRAYWRSKQQRNSVRDRRNIGALRRAGWRVLVIWECQTRNTGKLQTRISRFLSGGHER
ncbi:MAG: very short patch repair endonuclease [Bryobacteraceae bacterium]